MPQVSGEVLQVEIDEAHRSVRVQIDEELYPLDAIYGTSYIFIDRCFVFLTRPADRVVSVQLKARESASSETLDALAGEFANELLNQVLRFRLAVSTEKVREFYMARAFFTPPQTVSIDALLAELDAEELETTAVASGVTKA